MFDEELTEKQNTLEEGVQTDNKELKASTKTNMRPRANAFIKAKALLLL